MELKRIYLLGFMGCGKSTLGRALAKSLGWTFIDMDHEFETHHNTTISNYFEQNGEDGFRIAEREMLKKVAGMHNVIIGTGGGAPCFFDNIKVMNKTGLSIYLKLSPQILFERLIHAKQSRPLVANKSKDELLQFIQEKLEEREPYYNKSELIVDAGRLSVEEYVQIIKSSEELKTHGIK